MFCKDCERDTKCDPCCKVEELKHWLEHEATPAMMLTEIADGDNLDLSNKYDQYALTNAITAIALNLRGATIQPDEYHHIAWACWGQDVADRMYGEGEYRDYPHLEPYDERGDR